MKLDVENLDHGRNFRITIELDWLDQSTFDGLYAKLVTNKLSENEAYMFAQELTDIANEIFRQIRK